jgi:predicted ester cyclase
MEFWRGYQARHDHYMELLAEAEQERRIRVVLANQPSKAPFFAGALAWLGRRLVILGARLRARYDEAPHQPRVSIRGSAGGRAVRARGSAFWEGDHQPELSAVSFDSYKTCSRNAYTSSISTMSTERTKEIVRRYRAAHIANRLDLLDEIVAADLIGHNLLPGLPPGLEGGKMAHTLTLASFPDYSVITEGDLIAEGDKVVERWTCGGTFTGAAYFGTPANGKRFCVMGISIYRIAQGKIVEHWGEADFLGAAHQLGTFP